MKLHHIGIATSDIDATANSYCKPLGYKAISEKIEDKVQRAIVQFFKMDGTNSYIELVQGNSESSPLSKFVKNGAKQHHLCFQSSDISADLANLRENGFFIICEPVPATAFNDRKIAWAMNAERCLVELVEEKQGDILSI